MTADGGDRKTWTWAEMAAARKPNRTSVDVCIRGDLVEQRDRLDKRLEVMEKEQLAAGALAPTAEQADLAAQVAELEAEIDRYTVPFVFDGLPGREYRELEGQHPPTKDQMDEAAESGRRAPWNEDTFPVALVYACLVEPADVTLADVQKAYEDFGEGEWGRLWVACISVNKGVADPGPKSRSASVVRRRSETT